MRIIKPTTVKEWARRHPTAAPTLILWLDRARHARWRSLVDVRRDYPQTDAVRVKSGRSVLVFNIGSFRLVVGVTFTSCTLYMLRFMTHAEYDRGKAFDGGGGAWKNTL